MKMDNKHVAIFKSKRNVEELKKEYRRLIIAPRGLHD